MKYETRIKKSIDRLSEEQLLHELLKVRGVDNPSELLNLTEEVIHDPNLLIDMDYGLEMLKHYVDMQEPHIHIFFDTDCFTGDTKVKLLDGTSKTFEELVEMEKENPGQIYWVYSSDENGGVHAGKGYAPRISSFHDEICEIELDNGEIVKCTKNHRFMLRDGKYAEAQNLEPGQSLMSLYWGNKDYGSGQYYEYLHGKGYTHLVVANDVYGERPKQWHTHHINFNPFDNRPENLEYLTKQDHMRKHGQETYLCKSYNGSQKQKEDCRRARENGRYEGTSHFIKYNKTENNRLSTTKINQDENVKVLQAKGKLAKKGKRILDLGYELTLENIESQPWKLDERWGKVKTVLYGKEVTKSEISPSLKTILKYFSNFEEFVEESKAYNHKVKSVTIKKLDNPIPMYDLTVEDYHNFAIDLGNNSSIFVHNCDGLTSGAYIYLWLQRNFPHCILTFDCNEGKRHGLNEDIVSRIPSDTNLVIAPDSSSSDVEWHYVLKDKGIDLLILDHHEIDVDIEGTPACVINNQDGVYPNPTLSAPGVVYKFLDEFEYTYFEELGLTPNAHEYMDLVATGMVADLVDLRNPETRFFVLEGLKDYGKSSLLLQALIEEASRRKDMTEITIDTIGWDIAPTINAIFRQGDLQDRYDLFKALVNFEETRIYQPLKKTKDNPDKLPIEESLQANIIRRAKTIKGQQDREVKKEMAMIKEEIDSSGMIDNQVIIYDATNKIANGHSGLIANRLAQEYMRPALVLNGEGGSFRNYDKFPIDNLSDWLSSSGLITTAGHQGAGGIMDYHGNEVKLQQWCNEQLEGRDLTPVYHVDLEIEVAKLKNRHIEKVGKLMSTFGGKGMDKPQFVVKNIVIETADIQRLGKTSSMLKFSTNINGEVITFVRPFTSAELYKEMICESVEKGCKGINRDSAAGNKKIELTIIGEFQINSFNGKDYPQIVIKEFESKPVTASRGRRERRF